MQKKTILAPNPIMRADSYKFSHPAVYDDNIKGMFSYLEARVKGETIVPFGMQMWAIKNLLTPITLDNIDEAEAFAKAHGEPFERAGWEKVLNEYGGFLPVTIRAVPEGTRLPSLNIIASCECDDPDLFWLSSNLETNMQRGIWYPTTIASNDYKNWMALKRYAKITSADDSLVPFQLHDFGGRGVSSAETAEVGGAAHLVYFMGSDTIEGVRAANHYYDCDMAAYSVPASEHTVQCSFGSLPWQQKRYLEAMLNAYAKEGKIVSIVIDGYDCFREAQQICAMKDVIVASGAKVVLRPDSGDPIEIIPRLLELLEIGFGSTINDKGFKVLNTVGILQGDGIDYGAMCKLLAAVATCEFSSSNIVFGSGGGLLQKVNRDTYKFAQKASAILVEGEWKPIFKDPVTDPGKKSKSGRLTLLRSVLDGSYMTSNMDQVHDSEWEDAMVTIYDGKNHPGELLYTSTLEEIRARAMA